MWKYRTPAPPTPTWCESLEDSPAYHAWRDDVTAQIATVPAEDRAGVQHVLHIATCTHRVSESVAPWQSDPVQTPTRQLWMLRSQLGGMPTQTLPQLFAFWRRAAEVQKLARDCRKASRAARRIKLLHQLALAPAPSNYSKITASSQEPPFEATTLQNSRCG